jgi:dephospho-CoA kinase
MAYVVGLTGGIGSGKSTVCEMFARRGAKIVDADAIVHELQQPGTEVFDEMTQAFGPGIVKPDGTLDRPAVGKIVFADPDKRDRLQKIVWPRVGTRVAELVGAAADDEIVILDVPLMAESTEGSRRFANTIVVVDASPETQIAHLATKGIARPDAEARMAAQASRDERLKLADHVLTNDGSVADLEEQVDALWLELAAKASG